MHMVEVFASMVCAACGMYMECICHIYIYRERERFIDDHDFIFIGSISIMFITFLSLSSRILYYYIILVSPF